VYTLSSIVTMHSRAPQNKMRTHKMRIAAAAAVAISSAFLQSPTSTNVENVVSARRIARRIALGMQDDQITQPSTQPSFNHDPSSNSDTTSNLSLPSNQPSEYIRGNNKHQRPNDITDIQSETSTTQMKPKNAAKKGGKKTKTAQSNGMKPWNEMNKDEKTVLFMLFQQHEDNRKGKTHEELFARWEKNLGREERKK
jgi:hypothetical protein